MSFSVCDSRASSSSVDATSSRCARFCAPITRAVAVMRSTGARARRLSQEPQRLAAELAVEELGGGTAWQRFENGAREGIAAVDHLAAFVDYLKEVSVRAELLFDFVLQQPRLVILDEPPNAFDAVAQPVVDGVIQALSHDEPDRNAECDHGYRERRREPQREAGSDRPNLHDGGIARRQ